MAVDDFAPRLSFFFNVDSDFFEEIAKYRAARRLGPVGCVTTTALPTGAPASCASIHRRPACP